MSSAAGLIVTFFLFSGLTAKSSFSADLSSISISRTRTITWSSSAYTANQAPVANAGVNRSVTLPANSLVLSGTGTDADGTVVAYRWSQVSGPNTASFSSITVAGPTISGLVVGSYVFSLVVTDDQGATSVANQATVTVFPANQVPVASAGPAQTIVLPTASVKLSGTGTDADGTVVAYRWSQVSGPNTASFSSATIAAPTVGSLVAGSYVFSLIVTDDKGATSAANQVTMTVVAANQAPVASAGPAQTIVLPTTSVKLSGTGTPATGHSIATYQWSQVSGPSTASFSSLIVATPTVSSLAVGTYVFSLIVTDERGAYSAPNNVTITVNPATTGAVAYRLNAGGSATGSFAADAYFNPAPGSASSSAASIAGTATPALYQSERAGSRFSYALPVSNGSYSVVLHFAEFYWTQPGQRVFDVALEGQKVLRKYDIVAKAGPFAATTETLAVTVTDGVLNLDFSALSTEGGVDQAKLSALEVLAPQISACPSSPVVTTPLAYCLGTQAELLSNSVTLTAGAALRMYASDTAKTQLPATFRPSTTSVGTTTYYVAQFLNGCESARVQINVAVGSSAPPILIPPTGVDQNNIAAWGDSFTDAGYGQYPRMLSQLTGLSVFNGGIGGETSVQTKNRMIADTQKRNWPCVIWSGRNDSNNKTQVLSSIASMVASLGHSNYLIVPIFNGQGEGIGSYAYSLIAPLDSALAKSYGSHYLDVRSYIVSKYDPTKSQDVIDHAADTTPASLRSDFLHPNITGSNMIAAYIQANINKLFSVDYNQGSLSKPLSASFKVLPGGTLQIYETPTSTTALASGFSPPTTTVGTSNYYVSQVVNGCESSRTMVTVNVINNAGSNLTATSTSNVYSSIEQKKTNEVDSQNLLDAYPNPSVNATTIDFKFVEQQHYSLELYDIRGVKIKQIASGVTEPGAHHSFQLNSKELPNGIYYVSLVSDKLNQKLKLIVSH